MGILYVVATPIGNLEDLSPRAVRMLNEVSLIAAEDTRHTAKLLAHFGISTRTISYHAFNERSRLDALLSALRDGDVALVTDAGTPGISDPGVELVAAALDGGFHVRSVPGPSSLTSAISVTGLVAGPFTYVGFLPRDGNERRRAIGKAAAVGWGVVAFEAPSRIVETMVELAAPFAGRRFAIVRELSKIHETVERGRFGEDTGELVARNARGEIVIVIEGGGGERDGEDPSEIVRRFLDSGLKPADAAREAAALTGVARSELYRIATELRKSERCVDRDRTLI